MRDKWSQIEKEQLKKCWVDKGSLHRGHSRECAPKRLINTDPDHISRKIPTADLLIEEASNKHENNSLGHEKTVHKKAVDFIPRILSHANNWAFSNSTDRARATSLLSQQYTSSGTPKLARKAKRSELKPKPRGKSSMRSARKKAAARVSVGPDILRKKPNFRFAMKRSKENSGNNINKKSFETLAGTPKNDRIPRRKLSDNSAAKPGFVTNSTP
jgi:hypothetical protein